MNKHIRRTATWENRHKLKGTRPGKKSGIVDQKKLFRFVFCRECMSRTEHIYCESIDKDTVHMCYACTDCGTETDALPETKTETTAV